MTKGGISKTVFFGVMLGGKLADIAMAEKNPKYRVYFFFGLLGLVLCYWVKQTILEYLGDIRQPKPKEP